MGDAREGKAALADVRVRVLAAEPVAGQALAALLVDRTGADVGWSASVERIGAQLADGRPSVVLWAVRAVCPEAVATVSGLWQEHPVGLVMLVDDIDRDSLADLLGRGAHGLAVLRRSASPSVEDVLQALESVHSGRSSLDPEVLRAMVVAESGTRMDELTDAEREVAELIAQGLRNETIGRRLFKSERTVEKQVTSVFDKLGLCQGRHGHLDRRVATARLVIADKAGEALEVDALDATPP